jgi:hypothetical protein
VLEKGPDEVLRIDALELTFSLFFLSDCWRREKLGRRVRRRLGRCGDVGRRR